jgi:hypothetical protein
MSGTPIKDLPKGEQCVISPNYFGGPKKVICNDPNLIPITGGYDFYCRKCARTRSCKDCRG